MAPFRAVGGPDGPEDTLSGGPGNDVVSALGDSGVHVLDGDESRDLVLGGRNRDVIDGGPSHESGTVGATNCALAGGPGNDLARGGDGDDLRRGRPWEGRVQRGGRLRQSSAVTAGATASSAERERTCSWAAPTTTGCSRATASGTRSAEAPARIARAPTRTATS